jgi:integrase
MDDNPLRKVRKPKEPRGRVRFLSDDERQRLLHSCNASRNRFLYTLVVLALSTGARKMELLSLTWRDIDLQRGSITIHESKNDERRTLPLTGVALDLIRQHAKVRCIDTAFAFQTRQAHNLLLSVQRGNMPLNVLDFSSVSPNYS